MRLNSERIDFLGAVTCSLLFVKAGSAPEGVPDFTLLVGETVDELVTAVGATVFLFPNKDLEGAEGV